MCIIIAITVTPHSLHGFRSYSCRSIDYVVLWVKQKLYSSIM